MDSTAKHMQERFNEGLKLHGYPDTGCITFYKK